MNTEGYECKGCGRPVFYDWVTHGGDDNDNYYWHSSCYFIKLREMQMLNDCGTVEVDKRQLVLFV